MRRMTPAGTCAVSPLFFFILLFGSVSRGEEAGGATPSPSPATPSPAPAATTEPSPSRAPGELEPIIVTAERLPTARRLSGSAVSVLGADEINAAHSARPEDALATLPGLSFSSSGARGNLTALLLRGGNAHSTLVLYDGFRVNSTMDSLVSCKFETASALLVDRIEVARGAMSPLYGSDAVTGTVHFISRKGEGPWRGSAAFEFGSFETTAWRLALEGGTERGGLALELYSLTQIDGDEGDPAVVDGRDVEQIFWALRGDWAPDERTDLKLVTRGAKTTYENFTMGSGDTIYGTNALVGFEARRKLTPIWNSRFKFSYYTQVLRNERLWGTPARTADEEHHFTLDWQNDVTLAAGTSLRDVLTVGGELRWESGERTDTSFMNTNISVDRANQSLYLQNRMELAGSVGLTAGVRQEWNGDYGTVTTGRAGIAYLVRASGTRFHASWGRSFRAPDFFSLAYGNFGAGNPLLQPEENESVDAGFEQSLFDGRLRFGATFFQNNFTNLITWYDPTPGVWVPVDDYFINLRSARARGFEAQILARPDERFLMRVAITVNSTKDHVSGRPISLVPERVVSISTLWRPAKRVELLVRMRFVGDRQQSGLLVPGYNRLDLAGSVRLGRHAVLYGRLENATDASYKETAFGDLAPRRNFTLGLRTEW